MKSAFEWAVRMGYLERNPCTPVEPPKPEKRDPNPVDEPNIEKLAVSLSSLDSSGSRQLADAVRFAIEGRAPCTRGWRDLRHWRNKGKASRGAGDVTANWADCAKAREELG